MGRGLKQHGDLGTNIRRGVAPYGAWIETFNYLFVYFSGTESPRMGRGLKLPCSL